MIDQTMSFFLKAKAAHLFSLFIGIPFAILLLGLYFHSPANVLDVITILYVALLAVWLWSVAEASNQRLEPDLRRSPKLMVIGMIYATAYAVLWGTLFKPQSLAANKALVWLMVPMHLLAMAAVFYAFYFTAKRFATLEQGKDLVFYDFTAPFLMFWFFPIGVWYLQPRINRLLGESRKEAA